MLRLPQSEHEVPPVPRHPHQVLEAVQSRGEQHDLVILGADTTRISHTDTLWIFSPLLRSILGSLQNLQNNLVILLDIRAIQHSITSPLHSYSV